MSVWTVTLTRNWDDYKPAYGEPSQVDGPYLFSSEHYAKQFLFDKLLDFLSEETEDFDKSDRPDMFDEEGNLDIKTLRAAESFAEEFVEGEYVARRFEWELQETKLDALVPESGLYDERGI